MNYSILDMHNAYAAGFFDGEGYIGLRFRQRLTGAGCIDLNIEVVNRVSKPIQFLHETYGGSIIERQPSRGRKLHHRWCINGSSAIEFLKRIHPYLMVKKKQAEIAYKAYNSLYVDEKKMLVAEIDNIKREEGKGRR